MANREARKKKCKRIKKNGDPCGRWARDGYDVCPNHGAGTVARPGGRPVKTGLHSKALKKKLKEKIQRYRESKTLTDLRGNIAKKRALLDELIEAAVSKAKKKGKDTINIAAINNAVGILDAISKDIERLEKIEHGTKHTITVNVFHQSISIIVSIIDRNIPDEKTKARIFGEFAELGLSGDNGPLEADAKGKTL